MQIANREAIKDYVNKIALQVLEREIELFTANIGGIAKVATLTMLVSWQFFLMSWKRTTWRLGLELVLPFYGCAALTFGINSLLVGVASWSMIYGPSLAVRGPQGSTQRAISGLYSELHVCYVLFGLGQV